MSSFNAFSREFQRQKSHLQDGLAGDLWANWLEGGWQLDVLRDGQGEGRQAGRTDTLQPLLPK